MSTNMNIGNYCHYCSQNFSSRNLLFRHLRTECPQRNQTKISLISSKRISQEKVAVQVGYFGNRSTVPQQIVQAFAAAYPMITKSDNTSTLLGAPRISRNGSTGISHAVCETFSFLSDKRTLSVPSTEFSAAMNTLLPDEIRVFQRVPVTRAFGAVCNCEWWRYEYLVPVSVLLPEQSDCVEATSTGPNRAVTDFSFDNNNFRAMSKTRADRQQGTRAAAAASLFLSAAAGPTHRATSVPEGNSTHSGDASPSSGEQKLRMFRRLKKVLRAFQGRHNFQHFLANDTGSATPVGVAGVAGVVDGSKKGEEGENGEEDEEALAGAEDGPFRMVLKCYCRGCLWYPPLGEGEGEGGGENDGTADRHAPVEFACISVCTQVKLPPPARKLFILPCYPSPPFHLSTHFSSLFFSFNPGARICLTPPWHHRSGGGGHERQPTHVTHKGLPQWRGQRRGQ